DPEGLRALTHEVMIRTRRSSVVDDLNLPPRRPRQPEVKLTSAEADLYERTTEFLRRLYREGFVQPAAAEDDEKPGKKGVLQLAGRARAIKTHAKRDVLTKLLKDTPDRLVVFSDHRPTIELIAERVTKLGRQAIVYWGTHSTSDRDKRIRAFHDDQRSVLIATRAGSEGRNLQFCNVLVNYD